MTKSERRRTKEEGMPDAETKLETFELPHKEKMEKK